MSPPRAAPRDVYVVSTSRVAEARSAQRYVAALLPHRRALGGRLCVALRRLHTLAGEADYDQLRVSAYPSLAALRALRFSPFSPLLTRYRRAGVSELLASRARPLQTPRDWRELRAVWALMPPRDAHGELSAGARPRVAVVAGPSAADSPGEQQILRRAGEQPEWQGWCAFRASLEPLPSLCGAPPAPLPIGALTLIAFPSVRLALDAAASPALAPTLATYRAAAAQGELGSWSLLERVSLREMLTPV